jgi:signal transduction histidine kinase
MGEAASALRPRLASLALPALAIACALTAVGAADELMELPTSYAGASAAADAADLCAGLGLILAGGLAWWQPQTRVLGLFAILAGLAWFGPDWDGWVGGPSVVRGLGAAVTPFFLALLFHLAAALPLGRVRSRPARLSVAAVYATAATVSIGLALFRDPFLDPYCWRNCTDNAFVVHAYPDLARTLGDVWLYSALGIGVVLVVLGGRRLLVATAPARRILLPALFPAMVAGAAEAAYAVVLLRNPLENPERTEFASVFFARSLALCALALGIAWTILRARRTRSSVGRLAAELGEAPPGGRLQDGLASALRDPDLQVFYWLPGSERFVTVNGNTSTPPAPGGGRAVTPIARGGQPVALISHDPALLEGHELEREIGSAARLAIDNERLQVEVLAQLADLRASRARIVEAGDAARRRLERDLHDGAQQRLLALSYELRLARTGAEAVGDGELVAVLTAAAAEAETALADLREVAQGIYPAILTEAGLAAALATLADEAALPVELGSVTSKRQPAAVETTAYVTVAEGINDAAQRGATFVSVQVVREGDRLVVAVEDDGAERSSRLIHLTDRVGALGGSVDLGPTTLRAEVRCE